MERNSTADQVSGCGNLAMIGDAGAGEQQKAWRECVYCNQGGLGSCGGGKES